MVSTRGCKFKFSIGERVLCYEPDLSKAKVLYDSKVMEIIEAKDKKGKKIIEYLIHFQGWNSSWDRRVNEDFVLKDTDDNRQLQKDLAEKSQLQIGAYLYRKDRKKRSRLMSGGSNSGPDAKRRLRSNSSEDGGSSCSMATITGCRDDTDDATTQPMMMPVVGSCSNSGGDTIDTIMTTSNSPLPMLSPTRNVSAANIGGNSVSGVCADIDNESYSSSVESTIEDDRVALQIGDKLKTILEHDYNLITNEQKLINLPAVLPAITILENFVKHSSVKSLTVASQPLDVSRRKVNLSTTTKCERREKDYEKITNNISLRKEVADGLRLYFNYTLKDYLLYRQEKEQAEELLSEENLKNFTYIAAEQQSMDLFYVKQETPSQLSGGGSFSDIVENSQTIAGTQTSGDTTHDDTTRRRLRSHKNEENEVLFDIGLNPNPAKDSYCISSIASTSSGGSTPHNTTNSTLSDTNLNILKSLLPSNIGVTSKTKDILQNLFAWQLLPSNSLAEPSMIYGAVHLARLIVKLPDFLNATSISDDKLKLLLSHLDTFIEYLEIHPEWFGELYYKDTRLTVIKEDNDDNEDDLDELSVPMENKENIAATLIEANAE